MTVSPVAIRQVAEALLYPPTCFLLTTLLALVLLRRRPAALRSVILLCLAGMWLTATEAFGLWLSGMVEGDLEPVGPEQVARVMREPNPPGAVVVLGSGARRDLREWNGPDVMKGLTIQRTRFGARVARWSGLPILVSGGAAEPGTVRTEADLMAAMLVDELGSPVRWIEKKSLDTRANARESALLLGAAGVRRVFLVSDSLHLPRAARLFEQQGLRVVPVPASFSGARSGIVRALHWLPTIEGLTETIVALHEIAGSLWYRLASYRIAS